MFDAERMLSLEGKGMTLESEGMIRIDSHDEILIIMWFQGVRPRYYICTCAASTLSLIDSFQ